MPLLHKKASVNVNVAFNNNQVNGQSNGYTVNVEAGGSVPIDKHNSVQFQCIYLNNQSKDNAIIQTFSEFTFRVVYGFMFK